MLIPTLTNDYLKYCTVERRFSAHTVDAYQHDLKQFVLFVGRNVCATKALSVDRVQEFYADMSDRRQLSSSTIRRRLACLQGLARFGLERHGIENPFVEWRPRMKRAKRLPKALPRSSVSELIGVEYTSDQSETVFAATIIIATGLRVSELCAIRVSDVTDDGAAIRVFGKGSKDRVVYLSHPELTGELSRMVCRRRSQDGNRAFLFLNSRGNPMTPQTLRRRLHRLTQQSGVNTRVTPHILRHTAATLLIEQGTDIRFVQRLLGHSSITTTEIYTHVSDTALRSAISSADTMSVVLNC